MALTADNKLVHRQNPKLFPVWAVINPKDYNNNNSKQENVTSMAWLEGCIRATGIVIQKPSNYFKICRPRLSGKEWRGSNFPTCCTRCEVFSNGGPPTPSEDQRASHYEVFATRNARLPERRLDSTDLDYHWGHATKSGKIMTVTWSWQTEKKANNRETKVEQTLKEYLTCIYE